MISMLVWQTKLSGAVLQCLTPVCTFLSNALQGCDFSPWQSLKLIAWPSAATLLVMSLALEYGDIAASGAGGCFCVQGPGWSHAEVL